MPGQNWVGGFQRIGIAIAVLMSLAAPLALAQTIQLETNSGSNAAAADATPSNAETTHQQVKVLTPTFGDAHLKLTAFCLTKDGNVVALLNCVEAPAAVKPRVNLRLNLSPARPAAEKSAGKKPATDKPAAGESPAQSDSDSAVEEKKPAATAGKLTIRPLIRALATASSDTQAASPAGDTQPANADIGVAENSPQAMGSVAEIRLLNSDGKLLRQWSVDFQAQAINIDPTGNIVVAGDGVVARYDLAGKQLYRGIAPQMAGVAKNEKELEDQAREALLSQATVMEETFNTLKQQKEDLDAKSDDDLTAQEKLTKQRIGVTIAAYERMLENYKSPNEQRVKQMAQTLAGKARKINAIAANDKYVFITCGDPKGFGYSVWRTDSNFENPKQIVSGLSGCCGQMDVQCCGQELVVAENSRKRVVRYDAEGKKIYSFGKASRDGAGDTFGSCCNPMNTRLYNGKLLVSDSDGRVRLFTLDGVCEGEVGKAKVREGCKSSTVDISPDGNRLYYIDVNTSQICVLDRKPVDDRQAAVR